MICYSSGCFLNDTSISTSVKRDGIADILGPELDVNITFTDGSKEGYHLWVEEKGQQSTLGNVRDSNTVYTVPEEVTDRFVELLK